MPISHAGTDLLSRGASRNPALELEMLLREDAVAEHMSGAWLQSMLRQEPGCEFGSGFPDHRVQTRIEAREFGSQSYHAYSAIDVCQSPDFSYR